MNKEKKEFKSGDYIVLLHTCSEDNNHFWHGIPINHCYKLKDDYTTYHLYIEVDKGGTKGNGWGTI